MAVNRYSQGAVAQYNPMSMAEIARYPEMLRAKEDRSIEVLGELQGQLGQYNALEADLGEADKLTSQLDSEISSLSSSLSKEGYNEGAFRKLVDLKTRKNQLFSAQGTVGQAQNSYNRFQQYKKQIDALGMTGKISEPQRAKLIEQSLADFQGSAQGEFTGINAAVNPGVTEKIQQVAARVNSAQSDAIQEAGLSMKVDPQTGKEVWITKTGQTITTKEDAIKEAIKFVLSNDPNTSAYMEQMNQLGLQGSIDEEIDRLSSGADTYLGMNRTADGKSYQIRNPFIGRSTGTGKGTGEGPVGGPAGIQYTTTKDGIDFEMPDNIKIDGGFKADKVLDRLSLNQVAELTPEQQKEYGQYVFADEDFKLKRGDEIEGYKSFTSDGIRDWVGDIIDGDRKVRLNKEELKDLKAVSGSFINNTDYEEYSFNSETYDGAGYSNGEYTVYPDGTIKNNNGNELNIPKRVGDELRTKIETEYFDKYNTARQQHIDAGIITPTARVSASSPDQIRIANEYITPATIDTENIQIYSYDDKETEPVDADDAGKFLSEIKIGGFDKSSNVSIVTQDTNGGVSLHWEYVDNTGGTAETKVGILPFTSRDAAEKVINAIGGENADAFITKARMGDYNPGYLEPNPIDNETLSRIAPGYNQDFEGIGFKFAHGKGEVPVVEMYFGPEKPFTIGSYREVLMQAKEQAIKNGEDSTQFVQQLNAIENKLNYLTPEDPYPFSNMIEGTTLLQEFIKSDIANDSTE